MDSGQRRTESLAVTCLYTGEPVSRASPGSVRMEGTSPGEHGELCRGMKILFLAEARLSSFWQLIVDEKKQIFTSEKFLLMASEDGELPLP